MPKLFTCKLCGQQYTVVKSIKEAREIHEARYCPEYWNQPTEMMHPLG